MLLSRPAVALLVPALLLAGCGGSGDKAPTKESATAAAKAINLVAADLPSGFKGEASSNDDSSKEQEKEFLTCVGASTSDSALADISSDDFNKGQAPALQTISSSVSVVPDSKTAKADLAAFKASKAVDCLQSSFDKALKGQTSGQGVTIAPLKVTTTSPKTDGTDGGFGFLITTSASAAGLSFPIQIELQAFLVKHTEVQLQTLGVGTPVAADVRDAAFAKLVERAKKSAV